jgi:hypothetical protein
MCSAGVQFCSRAGACSPSFLIVLRCGELEWPWVRDSLACAPGVSAATHLYSNPPGDKTGKNRNTPTPGAQARESRTQGHSSSPQRSIINPLTPNDQYNDRTSSLTSKRCILYIYSTNIIIEYFKHGINSPVFSLQNAVCFIILTYLIPVLFTFYIQGVLQ